MRILLVIIVVIGLVISTFCLMHSQSSFELSFEHLNKKSGLHTGFNYFVHQDLENFIWVSSLEGIYRFDGRILQHFHPGETNSPGFIDKNVQSDIFVDRNANVWFASESGINRYNNIERKFHFFQLVDPSNKILSIDYHLFHLERDSTLWVKAGDYILTYNIFTHEQNIITKTYGIRFAVDTLSNGRLHTIYACPWMNNSGFEVITLKNRKLEKREIFCQHGLPKSKTKSLIVKGAIVDNSNVVWLFTDQGLQSFQSDQPQKIKTHLLSNEKSIDILDGTIYKERFLFLGTKKSALWIFDIHKKEFLENFMKEENSPNSLGSNSLWGIYIDKEDHLWTSNYISGLAYSWLCVGQNKFRNPFNELSTSIPSINSLVEDTQQRIWCSSNYGVYVFSREGEILMHFPYDPLNNNTGLFSDEILQLSISEEGEVWALSHQHLFKFDETRQQWNTEIDAKNKIFYNLKHLSNGKKIVSTNKGVYKLTYLPYIHRLEIKDKIISNDSAGIINFYKKNNLLFFPNKSEETIIYKYECDTLQYFKSVKVSSEIYTILEDDNTEETWIGTLNGLIKLDHQTMSSKFVFSKGEPLHNTKIKGINRDPQNKLWLTTNAGLFCYLPATDELLQFRKEDGLPSDQFMNHSSINTTDDQIWIGTTNGLVTFRPDSINPYAHKAQVYIESLKVNGNHHDLDQNFKKNDLIKLKYNLNDLEFKLDIIGYYLNQFIQIYYKLDEDADWNIVEDRETLILNNLSQGRHTLSFYSRNANGIKGDIKRIEIEILPPFWQDPKFILPILIVLGLLILLIFKWIVNRKLHQQKLLHEALQEERNRIAGEMHDDLGGEIYSIRFLTQKIQNNKDLEKTKKQLESKADGLVENMREIVWALDSNNDTLSELITYIRVYFIEFFEKHQIECSAQVPEDIPEIMLSAKMRRNIFLCIKEALHNVGKHAIASKVELYFRQKKKSFVIEIKDNGIGTNLNNNASTGNGIENMNNRMMGIGGKFKMKNDDGTTVIIEFPIYPKNKF